MKTNRLEKLSDILVDAHLGLDFDAADDLILEVFEKDNSLKDEDIVAIARQVQTARNENLAGIAAHKKARRDKWLAEREQRIAEQRRKDNEYWESHGRHFFAAIVKSLLG